MSKEQLIRSLNEDLAAEWGTIARCMVQANEVRYIAGDELRHTFLQEVEDRLEHITYLTDVIIDLGGKPTTLAESFETKDNVPAMLEQDLSLELEQVERYRQHARLAAELGQTELEMRLEAIAGNEAKHADALRRLLKEQMPSRLHQEC
jgi:bacterioferritin